MKMANEQFPADYAVQLPNLYPSPGEAMQGRLASKEREVQRQFAYDRDDRLRKEQEDKVNRLYNLREIDQDTDAAKYKTGEQAFDAYSIGELNKIKDKALAEYVNLDPAEMEYRLTSDMKDFLGWHSAAQSNIDKIKASIADANKTFPNIDATKIHDYAFGNLSNDFIQNGQRVDPMYIKPRDYVGEALHNDNIGQFVNDTTPLNTFIESFKPQPYAEKEYVDNRGYKHNHAYTAGLTPFTDFEKDANGKPIGIKLKEQTMDVGTDANGNPIKITGFTPEVIQMFMSKPDVKASALGLWEQVAPNLEQKVMQATGKPLKPAAKDILFGKFLHDYVKANHLDQSYFKEETATAIPRPPQTNIFIGNQTQPFNPQTSGTELDRIGSIKPLPFDKAGIQISNGVARDKNGNLFSGENLTLKTEDLPAGLLSVLKTGGVDMQKKIGSANLGNVKYWSTKIVDGRIEAIKPEGGSWIDRQDIFNYQLKNNTESMKGTQPNYGNTNQPKPTPTVTKNEFDQYKRH